MHETRAFLSFLLIIIAIFLFAAGCSREMWDCEVSGNFPKGFARS